MAESNNGSSSGFDHGKMIEKVAQAPAMMLDRTIDTSRQITENITSNNGLKRAKEYWKTLGPGLTTGAADDDPSGIATYSQAGAGYGNQLLWMAPFTFPLMAVVQEMCARIGLVTGRGLAGNIRLFFPRWVLYICTIMLLIANTFNIGADLGAMAKATQLLYPNWNFGYLVLFFTVASLGLQIFTTYDKYAKYLKWLALVLLSYVFSTLSIDQINWGEVLKNAFLPSMVFGKEQIILVTGILGTTISPYLFFWQTSQEVEDQILEGKTTLKLRQEETSKLEVKNMRVDVWSGMFLSNLVMFFIITSAAATLNAAGITNISTAADAAEALRPIAGDQAYLLFTIGIIGTGMLAVPILAGSAAYALSESFGWKQGLYKKLNQAYAFYGVIIISMVVGLALNFSNIDSIKALIYSAILNAIVAPIVLILIVSMSSNKKIMGNWVNHPIATAAGWTISLIMLICALTTVMFLFV